MRRPSLQRAMAYENPNLIIDEDQNEIVRDVLFESASNFDSKRKYDHHRSVRVSFLSKFFFKNRITSYRRKWKRK